MRFTIHKGRHRAKPLRFGFWIKKPEMQMDVYFDSTCKYDLPGTYDDEDVNKLFGIGYPWGAHRQSVRFGWHYNQGTGKIRLSAYCYVKGKRKIKAICDVPFFTWVRCSITVFKDEYYLTVADAHNTWFKHGDAHIPATHKKIFCYRLGLFFGGNKKAPHKMIIEMKKRKS